MSMNILAGPGDTVRFMNISAGRDYDAQNAREYLVYGEVYEVERVVVDKYNTSVWLVGIDCPQGFASVMFVDENIDGAAVAARDAYISVNPRGRIPHDTNKEAVHEN